MVEQSGRQCTVGIMHCDLTGEENIKYELHTGGQTVWGWGHSEITIQHNDTTCIFLIRFKE